MVVGLSRHSGLEPDIQKRLTAVIVKPTMDRRRYSSAAEAMLMPIVSHNPITVRRIVALLAAAATLLLVSTACMPGQPAVDFALTTFAGDEFRLSEQRGNVVVINFWYPSCPPCRDEMPAFQEVWEQYQGRRVTFIGLFVPQGIDSEEHARQFVDELGLTFQFATDVRAMVAEEYQVEYFPTTYFIDQGGRVALQEISRMDADRLEAILLDLLG